MCSYSAAMHTLALYYLGDVAVEAVGEESSLVVLAAQANNGQNLGSGAGEEEGVCVHGDEVELARGVGWDLETCIDGGLASGVPECRDLLDDVASGCTVGEDSLVNGGVELGADCASVVALNGKDCSSNCKHGAVLDEGEGAEVCGGDAQQGVSFRGMGGSVTGAVPGGRGQWRKGQG